MVFKETVSIVDKPFVSVTVIVAVPVAPYVAGAVIVATDELAPVAIVQPGEVVHVYVNPSPNGLYALTVVVTVAPGIAGTPVAFAICITGAAVIVLNAIFHVTEPP